MIKFLLVKEMISWIKRHPYFSAFLVLAIGIYYSWSPEVDWYRAKIPSYIQTEKPVIIDGLSDLREGCGVAIFWIKAETLLEIEKKGVSYLAQYAVWQETPLPEKPRIPGMYGTVCANLSQEWRQKINQALRLPGGFYAIQRESIILLFPNLGIVVFAYNG